VKDFPATVECDAGLVLARFAPIQDAYSMSEHFRRNDMTLNELRAFIEGMDIKTAPTTEQWARICGKLSLVEPEVQVVRIIEHKEPSYGPMPWTDPQPRWLRPTIADPIPVEPYITCLDKFTARGTGEYATSFTLPNNDGVLHG
jgi:hypothetical protein